MSRCDRWSRDNMPSGEERARIERDIRRTMKDAIADAYKGISQSGSMMPPAQREPEPVTPPGNGWRDAAPLVPPQSKWWSETTDEKRARQDALLNREIERRLSRTNPYDPKAHNPYCAQISYDPLKAYDDAVDSCHREKE